jgi:hypothetical protein
MVVDLPADTWTKAANAGFGSVNVHMQGNVSLLYALSPASPSGTDSGGVLNGNPVQQTIGTDDASSSLWLQPALPGIKSWARVV